MYRPRECLPRGSIKRRSADHLDSPVSKYDIRPSGSQHDSSVRPLRRIGFAQSVSKVGHRVAALVVVALVSIGFDNSRRSSGWWDVHITTQQ